MKSKTQKQSQGGFTMIEMLFVIGILAVFYGLALTNFGRSRTVQNLKNGQGELISQFQKIRSYSLSGRHISIYPPKYYTLRLEAPGYSGGIPTQYVIEGIGYDPSGNVDVLFTGGVNPIIERLYFPQTVSVKELNLSKRGVAQPNPLCVEVAFAVPYGRTYIDETCTMDIIYKDPATLNDRANSTLTVKLQRSDSATDERRIIIYGVSGRIEAN